MRKSLFTEEQIIAILKEGEAGMPTADLVRKYGLSPQTYYRWKSKYGGVDVSEARSLMMLEDENRRLKKIVAEQALECEAMKSALRGKW
jgi:putative transposase